MAELVQKTWRDAGQKMTYDEVQDMLNQVKSLKSQLRSGEEDGLGMRPDKIQDETRVRREIKRFEDILDKDDQLIARDPGLKDAYHKEAKDLEIQIRKFAPSRQESWTTMKTPLDFERAVEKQTYWIKKGSVLVNRWKELRRRLEPENPYADSVEKLMDGYKKVPE